MGMIGFGRWSVGDELGLCPPTACLLQGDGETMLMEPLGQGEAETMLMEPWDKARLKRCLWSLGTRRG